MPLKRKASTAASAAHKRRKEREYIDEDPSATYIPDSHSEDEDACELHNDDKQLATGAVNEEADHVANAGRDHEDSTVQTSEEALLVKKPSMFPLFDRRNWQV
jgi:hypothetical protein